MSKVFADITMSLDGFGLVRAPGHDRKEMPQ